MLKLLTATTFMALMLNAAGSPREGGRRLITGIETIPFIGGIHMADQLFADAKIIIARGYYPSWDEAIAADGGIRIHAGNIQIAKIFTIPFRDGSGAYKCSIIGGTIGDGQHGSTIHRFMMITGDMNTANIAIASEINAIEEHDESIAPLIKAIRAGDRAEIWSFIIGGTFDEAAISKAFQIAGYQCSAAPPGFPSASIWYASTCSMRIRN